MTLSSEKVKSQEIPSLSCCDERKYKQGLQLKSTSEAQGSVQRWKWHWQEASSKCLFNAVFFWRSGGKRQEMTGHSECHWSVALVEFSIELFSKCNWVKGRWAQIHGILFFLFLKRLMGMKCFSHSMNLSHEDSASKTCKQHVDKDLDSISNAWNALWVCVGEEKKHIINNFQH